MEATYLTIAIVVIIAIIFPVLAILTGNSTRIMLEEEPSKKSYVYKYTMVQLTLLMSLSLLPVIIGQYDLEAVGLTFITQWNYVLGLFASALFGLLLLQMIRLSAESAKKKAKEHERIQFLLPTTFTEYKQVAGLSFIAGICEEVIYRGVLFGFLSIYMNVITAAVLAGLPFALLHFNTTGLKNTLWSYLLALLFTTAYVLTGSLWLPILMHIMVDLYSATISYKSTLALRLENDTNQ